MHALEKEMATHSSILAWKIPGTEEPGGLLSMGSHRVGHDCTDLAAAVYKSASAKVMGSSTIHQDTFKEPCPPVHPVITKETSVLAVDSAVAHKLTPVPLSCGPGDPRKHCLIYPLDKRALVEVQISNREVSAHHWS